MSCGIKRIIKLNNAIVHSPIRVIDNNDNDITENCMFSWSTDNVCWSAWTYYNNYLRITPQLECDFYLRILVNSVKDCYAALRSCA